MSRLERLRALVDRADSAISEGDHGEAQALLRELVNESIVIADRLLPESEREHLTFLDEAVVA